MESPCFLFKEDFLCNFSVFINKTYTVSVFVNLTASDVESLLSSVIS